MSANFSGRKWKVVVNGRKHLNGVRFAVTYFGTIETADEGSTVYDLMRELADQIEADNREMQFPDSFVVMLPPA